MRVILYEVFSSINERVVGPFLRNTGKRLYEIGNSIEGEALSEDRLTPSLRRLAHAGFQPQLDGTNFVAPNATVLGNVTVGQNSSVWYGSTILGTQPVRIGDNTVVQDRVYISKGATLGNNVFVGPNTILQQATLKDRSFVSMGATVRNSTVNSGGFVAAGAVVNPGSQVQEGDIWAGNPAQFLRKVTPLEREVLRQHLEEMQDLAVIHAEQTQKTIREVINGSNDVDDGANLEDYLDNLATYNFAYTEDDSEYLEQRILLKEKVELSEWGQDYEPYRFENKGLPEKFRVGIHEEEFAKVALKLKQKESFSDKKPWTNAF